METETRIDQVDLSTHDLKILSRSFSAPCPDQFGASDVWSRLRAKDLIGAQVVALSPLRLSIFEAFL